MISASIVLFNTKKEDLEVVIKSFAPQAGRELFLIDNSGKRDISLEHKIESVNKQAYMQMCTGETVSVKTASMENVSGLNASAKNVAEKNASDKTFTWEKAAGHIKYIYNGKNLGYGSAHNIGIRMAIEMNSDYHVVLNPDLKFEPYVIDELEKYADANKDVVYMMPKVLNPDGNIQYLCKLLPTPQDLIFRRFLPKTKNALKKNALYELRCFGYKYDKIINPPCLSGCFMFMRVSALKKYNLFFDEKYFMYCEDFDLMRRLHRIGKTVFYPEVSVIHNHAKESYHDRKMMRIHIRSAIRYFNKFGWIFDKERKAENSKILSEIYKKNM